jgi:hypothetical protein
MVSQVYLYFTSRNCNRVETSWRRSLNSTPIRTLEHKTVFLDMCCTRRNSELRWAELGSPVTRLRRASSLHPHLNFQPLHFIFGANLFWHPACCNIIEAGSRNRWTEPCAWRRWT